MARPIDDEPTRQPTAISRPSGGWFARIWTERSAGGLRAPGGGRRAAPEKIRLGRSEPFTLWTVAATSPADGSADEGQAAAGGGSPVIWAGAAEVPAIPGIPSQAFTLWTQDGGVGEADAVAPVAAPRSRAFTLWLGQGEPRPMAVSPLPEAVFDEVDAEPASDAGPPRRAGSRAFTLWTERSAEVGAPVAGPLVDSADGDAAATMPVWREGAERAQKTAVLPLLALAFVLLSLLIALFVIAEKNKDNGKLRGKIGALKAEGKVLGKENTGLVNALQGERTKVAERDRQLRATKAVGVDLTTQRDGLRVDLAAAKKAHGEEVAALGKQIEGVRRELVGAEKSKAAIRKQSSQMGAVLVVMKKKIAGMESAAAAAAKRHAGESGAAAAKLKDVTARLDAATGKLAAAEEKSAGLGRQLAKSQGVVAALQKEIDGLRTKLAEMAKEVAPAPEEVPDPPAPVPEQEEGTAPEEAPAGTPAETGSEGGSSRI